jgi:hypothetical protein
VTSMLVEWMALLGKERLLALVSIATPRKPCGTPVSPPLGPAQMFDLHSELFLATGLVWLESAASPGGKGCTTWAMDGAGVFSAAAAPPPSPRPSVWTLPSTPSGPMQMVDLLADLPLVAGLAS